MKSPITDRNTAVTELRVLYVTTQWPTEDNPTAVPFVVRHIEYMRQANIQVDVFHFRSEWRLRNYWLARREMLALLHDNNYDLIHANFAQAGLLAIMQARVPVSVLYGGTDVLGRRRPDGGISMFGRLQRFIALLVSRRASANIVVSRQLGEVLNVNYDLIPAGLDLNLFKPIDQKQAREQLNLSSAKYYALFLGNPDKAGDHKRFHLAQKSVELAQKQLHDLEFLPVWNVPHTQIPVYMSAANVLLLTSRSEGSPNVVKEALACNLSVVSVDVGDVRERLTRVEGTIICENDKPETIAKGIIEICTNYPGHIQSRETIMELDEALLMHKTLAVFRRIVEK